jgi:hypothetical protein
MKRSINLLLILLTALAVFSCSEIIQVAGVFTNRINDNSNYSGSIYVSVRNPQGKLVPNFLIDIVNPDDSLKIFSSRFTLAEYPQTFIIPDEQINPVSCVSGKLLVIINHPNAGVFSREVLLSGISSTKSMDVEFETWLISDTLSKAPLHRYRHFRSY